MSGSGSTIFCLGEPGSGADIFEAAVRRAAVLGRCGRHWESPWENHPNTIGFRKHHRVGEFWILFRLEILQIRLCPSCGLPGWGLQSIEIVWLFLRHAKNIATSNKLIYQRVCYMLKPT